MPAGGCLRHDRLVAAGIDLRAYNTAENASDVADLRQALHVREWDLVGNSYGSRLALTVLRDHPRGVRALGLSGVYPPNENSFYDIARATADAFDGLFAEGPPDGKAQFVTLLERLGRSPHRVTATTADGRQLPILIDGDNLVTIMSGPGMGMTRRPMTARGRYGTCSSPLPAAAQTPPASQRTLIRRRLVDQRLVRRSVPDLLSFRRGR